MTSRQAFLKLAYTFDMGLPHHPGLLDRFRVLALSLRAISRLYLPGSANAVLTGFEAQGKHGWSAELAQRLRDLGLRPGSPEQAAEIWKAVTKGALARSEYSARYRTIARTYEEGLEQITKLCPPLPQPAHLQPGRPQQGRPQQGRPQQGRPQQGRPQPDRPRQSRPQPGRPQQNRPQQSRPQPGRLGQGRPRQQDNSQRGRGRPPVGPRPLTR